MTKNALKSPQGIEWRHSAHHSTRLDELFQMIYRSCDHVVGRKKKCQRLYELTNPSKNIFKKLFIVFFICPKNIFAFDINVTE